MISSPQTCYSLADLDRWQDLQPTLSPPARLAVIGDPISHSKSPQMHNPALAATGVVAQYVRVQVPVGSVAEALRTFARQGFWGVNVTIPHKFEALDAVDEVDPLARKLGAVNTVAIREGGRLHGYNTDGPGFLRSVKEAFGADIKDLRVLILGAGGGAGRAVAVQCALENCPRLVLANRTMTKVTELARELGTLGRSPVKAIEWNDDSIKTALPEVDLIVNGTSLGMKEADPLLLPEGVLEARHLVFDMVYRPGGQFTPLGAAAGIVGARYVDGRLWGWDTSGDWRLRENRESVRWYTCEIRDLV